MQRLVTRDIKYDPGFRCGTYPDDFRPYSARNPETLGDRMFLQEALNAVAKALDMPEGSLWSDTVGMLYKRLTEKYEKGIKEGEDRSARHFNHTVTELRATLVQTDCALTSALDRLQIAQDNNEELGRRLLNLHPRDAESITDWWKRMGLAGKY